VTAGQAMAFPLPLVACYITLFVPHYTPPTRRAGSNMVPWSIDTTPLPRLSKASRGLTRPHAASRGLTRPHAASRAHGPSNALPACSVRYYQFWVPSGGCAPWVGLNHDCH
jgi:hypothetical protein